MPWRRSLDTPKATPRGRPWAQAFYKSFLAAEKALLRFGELLFGKMALVLEFDELGHFFSDSNPLRRVGVGGWPLAPELDVLCIP